MQMRFEMKPDGQLMQNRGLVANGAVQRFIDQECIRLMDPYTPKVTGTLIKAATIGTKIGSGKIEQTTPYARYLYYGEVYGPSYPICKDGMVVGFYSPPKKEKTGREIKYNTAVNPKAGKMWFERMKADHKERILAGARKIAGGKK